ncbi:hypothetical protein ADUPG1_007994 [Aduncisulcus paluster]|uniref:t-SNARE coiled-coil homology domain-containing protein n=1 Tax=Aduncisulcus paluster TaxID=2918883 RepID=A0ABQ5KRR0_9EUKA|nr:hypothetical protein ADUPG1_007994 [Aduncisulcus paluster]|eukprot:gnl/Carplike_NY0171/1829_a2483_1083.p1 GENE.gnl/Carplike_NY0171/1829_a2483_1083~~gnl/Carplike_NY0171/1829_a2483_1083.p1  ORF type:complete len:235 (-),score=60.44 gnl/Carplike_NY0171/1829_a2483_1083:42-746(-)
MSTIKDHIKKVESLYLKVSGGVDEYESISDSAEAARKQHKVTKGIEKGRNTLKEIDMMIDTAEREKDHRYDRDELTTYAGQVMKIGNDFKRLEKRFTGIIIRRSGGGPVERKDFSKIGETEYTKARSDGELMSSTMRRLDRNDDQLDELHDVVVGMKHQAVAIHGKIDETTTLVDDLHKEVDETEARTKTQSKEVSKLSGYIKRNKWPMFLTLLAIILLIYLLIQIIKYGGKPS